jgi:hypothetical protein
MASRTAYLFDWAKRDREFAWRQAQLDEKVWPGIKAAVRAKLKEHDDFCKPTRLFEKEE